MPRRHQRADHSPLTVTAADIPTPPKTREERARDRAANADRAYDRKRAEEQATIDRHLGDRSTCLVPGCTRGTPNYQNPDDLPLCAEHVIQAWRMVQRNKDQPELIETAAQQVHDRATAQQAAHELDKQRRHADTNGHIYYLRLNGLIKAGWTRDLHSRLKAYGPDVEVLCHHPGTRADETNLHRNLRPFLARGREWYQDSPGMRDIIARTVQQHGTPEVAAVWTKPAPPPTRRRKR